MNNIHVICGRAFETGKLLASLLDGTSGEDYKPGAFNVAFGFGFGHSILNKRAIVDKCSQLAFLENARVSAVRLLLVREDVLGIPQMKLVSDLDPGMYPIISRKRSHSQGRDIVFIEKPTDFSVNDRLMDKVLNRDCVVQYVPKTREFRVHVCGGRWVSVAEKKSDDTEKTGLKRIVWAKRNGYYHSPMPESDPLRSAVGTLAVKAAKVLHFDFGAVDILLGEDNKLYVLEINSAPSLNNRRAAMYARYIMEQYNTWNNAPNRNESG